ncbi:MAG: hypothetical protein PHU98_06255 [Mariniphaga sp.]|nr:hypothetical protein [Mariniphaga sp.]
MNKIEKIEETALVKVINDGGLAIEEGETIKASYQPFLEQLAEIQEQATKINFESPAAIDETIARELRLKTVKIRTGAAKIKDDRKRGYLLKGNLEQAAYNLIAASCAVTENAFNDVEKAREITEKKRIEALKLERTAKLTEIVEDPEQYKIFPLGEMSEQAWDDMYTGLVATKKAKEEAAAKAEAERLAKLEAERIENEKIRLENIRLQKEKEEAELKAKAERDAAEKKLADELAKAENARKEAEEKATAEKKAIEEKARIEREKAEAAALKLKAENDRKLAVEKAEKDRIAKELQAKKDAELKAEQEKQAAEKARLLAEKAAAKAPDKTKLNKMIIDVKLVAAQVTTPEGLEVEKLIFAKFSSFKIWASNEINKL